MHILRPGRASNYDGVSLLTAPEGGVYPATAPPLDMNALSRLAYADPAVVDATNLLDNPDFEGADRGYTLVNGGFVEIQNNVRSGGYAGRLKHTAAQYASHSRIQQMVSGLSAAVDYASIVYVQKNTASTGTMLILLNWFDAASVLISTATSTSKVSAVGTWSRHSFNAVAPALTAKCRIDFYMSNGIAGDLSLDDAWFGLTSNTDIAGPTMAMELAGG